MDSHSLEPLDRKAMQDDCAANTGCEIRAAAASPGSVDHQSCDTSVNISAVDPAATSPSVQETKRFSICTLIKYAIIRLYVDMFASMAMLPLLVVSYLFIRLLQIVRHGHDYYNVTRLKLFIRIWMCIIMAILTLYFGVAGHICKYYYAHSLHKDAGRSIRMLTLIPVSVYFIIFDIFFLSSFLPNIVSCVTPKLPLDHTESGLHVREAVVEIIDCVLFWWIESEVMNNVPAFKHHKILGLHTQQWIKVSLFVLIGYNVIILSTRMIVYRLRILAENLTPTMDANSIAYILVDRFMSRKYLMYCANGMKHSINFMFSSLMLLLTWVLYFRSHLNETHISKKVLEFGTWTCVSVLFCSVFWLIKTCVLLSWETTIVYDRLNNKLIVGGKQLFYLGIIGRHNHDIFKLLYDDDTSVDQIDNKRSKNKLSSTIELIHLGSKSHNVEGVSESIDKDNDQQKKQPIRGLGTRIYALVYGKLMREGDRDKSESDKVDECATQRVIGLKDHEDEELRNKMAKVKKLSSKVKKRVKYDLLIEDGHNSTIYGIQQVAQYLLSARETLLNENYISDILLYLERGSEDGILKQEFLKQLIELGGHSCDACRFRGLGRVVKPEWDYFQDQLQELSEEISLEKIGAWMDRAADNCLFLANTLSSAKEVVGCLNQIISWLLTAVTFIMWLLLTGLATTKVLVLIASPVLAATFIFGDTCKTLFQGFMFTYVVHPFDVGDLCVIDDKMMEVRTIGVWKSTFSKVGTHEDVIYTNLELSNKSIVNHKTEFDWNDCVELDGASFNKHIIMQLQQEIKKHLDDNTLKFKPGHNCVALLISGDSIKISISFRHNNVDPKDRTYSECLKAKHEQRSELVLFVYDLVEQRKKNEIPKTSGSYSVAENSTEQAQVTTDEP